MLLILTPLLIFVAFLLLLLVSLSIPIIKTIYLFSLASDIPAIIDVSVSGNAKFGVWGYCVSPIELSFLGFSVGSSAFCSEPKLGYNFDGALAQALQVDEFADLISQTIAAALVLHPIACGLTFLTLLISLFTLRKSDNGTSRLPSLCTLGIGIVTAILTTISFLVDVIFVAVFRNKVDDGSHGNLKMNWGNAVWMVLGATLALWFAMAGTLVRICPCGRRNRNGIKY